MNYLPNFERVRRYLLGNGMMFFEAAIISATSFAWRLEVTPMGVYMSHHRSLAERLGRFALFS
jgi:hypothetical protein